MMKRRLREIFDRGTWDNFENDLKSKELFLYGAGSACIKFMNYLGEPRWHQISGIIDRNRKKQGKLLNGIMVSPISVLKEKKHEDVMICITSSYMREIAQPLIEMGYENLYFWERFNNIIPVCRPPIQTEDMVYIEKLKGILDDEESRILVDDIVRNRKEQRKIWLELNDMSNYFNTGICTVCTGEHFVDGGAFDGDTIVELRNEESNCHITAFEPDARNYQALQEKYQADPSVTLINAGLWNSDGTVHFSGNRQTGSFIDQEGDISIDVVKLDSAVDTKVDFIKMDIEGAELEALAGCKRIITEQKPKLAICIYHKYDDLWKIPLYVKQLVPEYHISIRHQSNYSIETVMFAYI